MRRGGVSLTVSWLDREPGFVVPKSIDNVRWGGGFLRKIIQKSLTFINFTITRSHVNTLRGPLLVTAFEAWNCITFVVNLSCPHGIPKDAHTCEEGQERQVGDGKGQCIKNKKTNPKCLKTWGLFIVYSIPENVGSEFVSTLRCFWLDYIYVLSVGSQNFLSVSLLRSMDRTGAIQDGRLRKSWSLRWKISPLAFIAMNAARLYTPETFRWPVIT